MFSIRKELVKSPVLVSPTYKGWNILLEKAKRDISLCNRENTS